MRIIDITTASNILLKSGIIAFPTETVYGLGAMANNQIAISKVFKAKNRPKDNPLICHFNSVEQIKSFGIALNRVEQILFDQLSPGPLCLLLDLPNNSPLSVATGNRSKIACRIPNHTAALDLITKVKYPIAAPSANTSTRPSCTTANMVLADLGNKIDGVIDGEIPKIGIESTIIEVGNVSIKILRPGSIGKSEILNILSKYSIQIKIQGENTTPNKQTVVPGSKYPHYSPKTTIIQTTSIKKIIMSPGIAVIASKEKLSEYEAQLKPNKDIYFYSLGSKKELTKVSQFLYKNLSELDSIGFHKAYLLIENWGETSLGLAIANRLSKVGKNN
ncbi:MAG: L-threonylcarbamoyladenylate synthase [Patescibacteria group bacterium]